MATTEDDHALEAAVLRLLLIAHPEPLTTSELARELRAAEPASLAALTDAIDHLVAVGLLRRNREAIAPTRAALHFDRLPVD